MSTDTLHDRVHNRVHDPVHDRVQNHVQDLERGARASRAGRSRPAPRHARPRVTVGSRVTTRAIMTPVVAGGVALGGLALPGAAQATVTAGPAALAPATAAAPAQLAGATLPTAPAATAVPAASLRVYLRRGSRGADVLAVQRRLGVRPQTGYFGRITERAVKRFQRSRGLVADGIVGPKTWAALGIGNPPADPPTPPTPPPPPSTGSLPPGYTSFGSCPSHVRAAAIEMGPRFGITRAGCWRSSSGDHGRGLAVDFMTYSGGGLAEYARANAGRLRVHYIIWNRRIWNVQRAGDGWRPYSGSSPHTDHVHVSFFG